MQISIFIFDGMTALDAVGPYEALRRIPNATVSFVGITKDPVSIEGSGFLITPKTSIKESSKSDVLILSGGGDSILSIIGNQEVIDWVNLQHLETKWTCSVCTGSLILGAAGLLKGVEASTHWRAQEYLPKFGAIYTGKRITESGKVITSSGVSAGIDMGFRLCELLAGKEIAEAIQLSMEYNPEPKFSTGNPLTASDNIRDIAINGLKGS